jgi:hypothetical protein
MRYPREGELVFSQTETCFVLSLVNGSPFQPLQRSRSFIPASRAIRSSSDGHDRRVWPVGEGARRAPQRRLQHGEVKPGETVERWGRGLEGPCSLALNDSTATAERRALVEPTCSARARPIPDGQVSRQPLGPPRRLMLDGCDERGRETENATPTRPPAAATEHDPCRVSTKQRQQRASAQVLLAAARLRTARKAQAKALAGKLAI